MFGIQRKDLLRLILLTLLGLTVSSLLCAALCVAQHSLLPFRWPWASPNLEMQAYLSALGNYFFRIVPSLLVAAGIIRYFSPQEVRLNLGSLILLAAGATLLPLCASAAWHWYCMLHLPNGDPLLNGAFNATLFVVLSVLTLAWNLTWSLDAVRRRRQALDAAGKP